MLCGFKITETTSLENIVDLVKGSELRVDFLIVDHQSEVDILQLTQSLQEQADENPMVIHLFTPTSETLTHYGARDSKAQTNVVRMTKPPRRTKILQMLAVLKNLHSDLGTLPKTDISQAMQNIATVKRSLYGNVLVAEGAFLPCNPFALD
jgi:hypothetical protein